MSLWLYYNVVTFHGLYSLKRHRLTITTIPVTTTSEWSIILLPSKERLILEVWWYFSVCTVMGESHCFESIPDCKVHGANMGPIWGWQDPGGPHVGPMNLVIWDVPSRFTQNMMTQCMSPNRRINLQFSALWRYTYEMQCLYLPR